MLAGKSVNPAKHVSHAKAVVKDAVNAVVVATNAAMKPLRLTVAKPHLPMATRLRSVPNVLNQP